MASVSSMGGLSTRLTRRSDRCRFAHWPHVRLKLAMSRNPFEYAYDPIPAEAIRLSEAYARVLEAINAGPQILQTLEDFYKRDLRKSREHDEQSDNWLIASETSKRDFHRGKEAYIFFSVHLAAKELLAYVRDPENGDILQLDPGSWEPSYQVGIGLPFRIRSGMDSDFIDPDEYPGPETYIRGSYRPVFFWRDEFDRWLKKTFGDKARRGGRPRGSGSWRAADRDLLKKMSQLIKSGSAKSPNDAARQLAEKAQGSGTLESKQSRLARSYRASIWSQRN